MEGMDLKFTCDSETLLCHLCMSGPMAGTSGLIAIACPNSHEGR